MSTPYHARYFARELTRQRSSGEADRLSTALFDAAVDLNPHQIDAALFALQSPLGKGVLLADEVGLGKTIEAGLLLCQYWAERRRRLLVVCPASLRKQWDLELTEKFCLPTRILDAAACRQMQRDGNPTPFAEAAVIIVSINFASAMQAEVRSIPWDLVVIDEAHKLRNAYRPGNRMGQRLRWALEERRKVLLTATPLQNSLLELYGLSTFVDEHLFGDAAAFRARYMRQDGDLADLRQRLNGFCKRTLRNQVSEYVRYTERRAITQRFYATDDEHALYESLSDFLSREGTYSIPARQRSLTTLILRKLLASSSRALIGTLETMKSRLEALRDGKDVATGFTEGLILREEMEGDYLEEIAGLDEDAGGQQGDEPPLAVDPGRLQSEIAELDRYLGAARAVTVDTRSRSLLSALEIGFAEVARMGAARKALVFTESRRTQEYLKAFLEANGYAGRLVVFNGTNTSPESRAIYQRWLAENAGNGRSTGSAAVDLRTALLEHFRDEAEVMIATEAGAEGVNLQFCSLVVNYDLPWNPQRIEQRIGRCHRYGQQHDVVVINFLNDRNEADRRVLELLTQKFHLFGGIFGASDEVLGTLESGVDFEKRILAIYQQCRTQEEIGTAFSALQKEMDDVIQARLQETRRTLLEHFDEDVHARLRLRLRSTREQLDQVGRLFWELTRFVLRDQATFDDGNLSFELRAPPLRQVPAGRYRLATRTGVVAPGAFRYRLTHPLGEHVLEAGKSCSTPLACLVFDITTHPTRIALVEALRGRSGWLALERLSIESFEREEYLLFSALREDGAALDQETCERLFRCTASVLPAGPLPPETDERLDAERERHAQATLVRSLERGGRLFQQERERLARWADDMVVAAEKDLADTKAQIRAVNRQARLAGTTAEQHALQLKLRDLERLQRRQRQRIFDVEDEIAAKRDGLIQDLERRMARSASRELLFTVCWKVE